MTTQAKKVLNDLQQSHAMLEIEKDYIKFRVLWVAAITLARAVGHMLDKVDSRQSASMKIVIEQKWKKLKENKNREENKIFFNFIENGRNQILKEYEFGMLFSPTDLVVENVDSVFVASTMVSCIYIPFQDGVYAGEDCRDILAEAIIWWKKYINEIDEQVMY
ncbi:hypothetical protein ES754_06845 [Psychrobacter frigidicola]|uniref:Uncharacterized protein n=1 Tax=Psychrobacter frigidicola TaxID=45611 RepID=A0A5C7A0L7_9GAMM|nr:hypothetical protein [Psychrobacter frigidicola]TXD96756.1 hypothetical protein ES754_06845 [Psychrobacter frigidicola]